MDPEIEVLKWFARPEGPWPSGVGGVDVDRARLLELVTAQRLGGRALRRLRGCPGHPLGATFVGALAGRQAVFARAFRERAAQAAELAAAAARDGVGVVFIKGLANLAHSGDPATARYSHDLDVLADDPEALRRVLRDRLGYGEMIPDSEHEYAKLRRGAAVVEIHARFPVASYPVGLVPPDRPGGPRSAPPASGGGWFLPGDGFWREAGLTYREAAEGGFAAPDGLAAGLHVPSREVGAFILCAHSFRNYLHHGFRVLNGLADNPSLSLQEVADFLAIVGRPEFRWDRFRTLLATHGGGDAFGFMQRVLDAIGVSPPWPPAPGADGRGEPEAQGAGGGGAVPLPRPLLHGKGVRFGWVASERLGNLLRPQPFAEDVRRLVPVGVPLGRGGGDAPGAVPPGRLLFSGPHVGQGGVSGIGVAACLSGDLLRFTVTLTAAGGLSGTRALLHFGDARALGATAALRGGGEGVTVSFPLGQAAVERWEEGLRFHLACPAGGLLGRTPGGGSGGLPALLWIGTGAAGRESAGVAVPVAFGPLPAE